jgi:hypothetical protein
MRKLWIVGESLPLRKDGTGRIAKLSANLPERLVPLDPRHGVFPNLVMKPLFAATFAASKIPTVDLSVLLEGVDAVVRDDSDRRFNLFSPRITDQKENAEDRFEIDEEGMARRITSFQPGEDLWLVFGHQTNFGLLKWLLEGEAAKSHTRKQLEVFSASFVGRVIKASSGFVPEGPTSKSGRVGLFHRLCTEGSRATDDAEKILNAVISGFQPKAGRSAEWIVDFLRSTVPLLHNEAYQDGPHPTGNAQAHFVRNAVRQIQGFDLYWQVMGNAIAQRAFNSYVG